MKISRDGNGLGASSRSISLTWHPRTSGAGLSSWTDMSAVSLGASGESGGRGSFFKARERMVKISAPSGFAQCTPPSHPPGRTTRTASSNPPLQLENKVVDRTQKTASKVLSSNVRARPSITRGRALRERSQTLVQPSNHSGRKIDSGNPRPELSCLNRQSAGSRPMSST